MFSYTLKLIFLLTILLGLAFVLNVRTDTDWFHNFCLKAEIRWIRGRLWFRQEDGRTGRPRLGSAVVIFRPNKTLAMDAKSDS